LVSEIQKKVLFTVKIERKKWIVLLQMKGNSCEVLKAGWLMTVLFVMKKIKSLFVDTYIKYYVYKSLNAYFCLFQAICALKIW